MPIREPPLRPREVAILRLVAEGLPDKAIAAALKISQWTVATELRRLCARFGVSTRVGLAARAAKRPGVRPGGPPGRA